MADLVQIKATIPRPLKQRAFAALALHDERFNRWLRTQLEDWLRQVETEEARPKSAAHGAHVLAGQSE